MGSRGKSLIERGEAGRHGHAGGHRSALLDALRLDDHDRLSARYLMLRTMERLAWLTPEVFAELDEPDRDALMAYTVLRMREEQQLAALKAC